MNLRLKLIAPLFFTFLACTLVFFGGHFVENKWGIDYNALIAINSLFFLASLLIFRLQYNAMQDKNPQVFVRSIMSGTLIKMLICVAVIVGYVLLLGKNFNKPVIYIAMVLYVVYLVTETRLMMKLNKNRNA